MSTFVTDVYSLTKKKLLRDYEVYKKIYDTLGADSLPYTPPGPHIARLTRLTVLIWSAAKSLHSYYVRLFHAQRRGAPHAAIRKILGVIEAKTSVLNLAKRKYHRFAISIATNSCQTPVCAPISRNGCDSPRVLRATSPSYSSALITSATSVKGKGHSLLPTVGHSEPFVPRLKSIVQLIGPPISLSGGQSLTPSSRKQHRAKSTDTRNRRLAPDASF